MKNKPKPNIGTLVKRSNSLGTASGTPGESATPKSNAGGVRNHIIEEPEFHRSQTIFEAAEEVERWDAVPVPYGRRLPMTLGDNTDGDDRSDSERMVYNGMADAEQDIRLQAIEEADRIDWFES